MLFFPFTKEGNINAVISYLAETEQENLFCLTFSVRGSTKFSHPVGVPVPLILDG